MLGDARSWSTVPTVNDELEILLEVAQRLDAARLPYMLSGSMALNFYGQPRMTRNIDLVVEIGRADAAKVVELFEPDFACDLEEVRDAISREQMFNIIQVEKVMKVDLIIRKSAPFRLEEFARRSKVALLGREIWIVSPEDLLLSKLHWAKDSHSEMQLGDVRNLIDAVPDLDWAYINRWSTELGVTQLLHEVKP